MLKEEGYRSWEEFESMERRRVGTFQLSIDDLARDWYMDGSYGADEEEERELNFD
ncbi:MAG: hypothetical protein M0R76_03150 [Proteobacteria bacterium]|jgi:hypothetical protein|nr:hypothetical protein [Pseudomonadota bacterium]NLN61767.1 hypothetical protein [Myxococcales bacterium]